MKKIIALFLIVSVLIACKKKEDVVPTYNYSTDYTGLSEIQSLGKQLFFDTRLSTPEGQSCASCHSPNRAFTDPDSLDFSIGADKASKGLRNSPSIQYKMYIPKLVYDAKDTSWEGGIFYDGRAKNLIDQISGPMLGAKEMNNGTIANVVAKLKKAGYSDLIAKYYGSQVLLNDSSYFNAMAQAIYAFESSGQVNTFTSKFDLVQLGKAVFTDAENRGLKLFDSSKTNCSSCHPMTPDKNYGLILFTDNGYDNIGVPHNPNATQPYDLGLFNTMAVDSLKGRFKAPSLRNVAKTAPYFHNGYFKTLKEAVQFYSDRDIPGKYPSPEIPQTVNKEDMGNLQLTDQEINDLVSFLQTLSDGYFKN